MRVYTKTKSSAETLKSLLTVKGFRAELGNSRTFGLPYVYVKGAPPRLYQYAVSELARWGGGLT